MRVNLSQPDVPAPGRRAERIGRSPALAVLMLALAAPAPAGAQPDRSNPAPPGQPTPRAVQPEPAREPAVPSFAHLFRSFGRDAHRLASRRNLVWFALGGGMSASVRGIDDEVTTRFATSGDLEAALDAGRTVGAALVQVGGAFATYTAGRLARSAGVARLGADLVRAQLLTGTVTLGIKLAVRRTRPDGGSLSFPSGHSAGAFASATVLHRHYGWKVGGAAYGVAAYVAASRLSENRHFPSDVIFGATVGILAARTVTIGRRGRRLALAPLAVDHGAGIALVMLPAR